MKSPYYRIVMAAIACFFLAGTVLAGCSGGEQEHAEDPAESEAPDPNTEARQANMKEIAKLCEGIARAVEEGSVGTVKADVEHLKGIMEEVATMPPMYDATRFGFYAADFQIRAETLLTAAETGSAIEADSALQALTVTCGVCHYNCKFPTDL